MSAYQGNVNWNYYWNIGKRFAYVKATEGTGYRNGYFAQQYVGSYNRGFIRGAYHFARPNLSSGSYQADYFVNHGGGWSRDGKTLPGALDIENVSGVSYCFGYSQAGMRSWIWSFVNRYHARTGRYPVIYTYASWWKTCTGGTSQFTYYTPFWVARYASSPGSLAGFGWYTFWQYSGSVIDKDVFNGTYARLQALARG